MILPIFWGTATSVRVSPFSTFSFSHTPPPQYDFSLGRSLVHGSAASPLPTALLPMELDFLTCFMHYSSLISMSFESASSKAKAKATVNKLFADVLPGASLLPLKKLSSSTASDFALEAKKKRLSKGEVRKQNKAEKAKQNKKINKKLELDKKFQKLVRYNVIKSHKGSDAALSTEEEKYLKKLVKKNSNALKRFADVNDPDVQEEITALQEEIIAMTNAKYDRSRDRKLDAKLLAFNDKIKSGTLSYPGLTPGLAPVGLDDESDESDEE